MAEAQALAEVCRAEEDLSHACEKRDVAVAAASAGVEQAQRAVEAAQSALVGVSGIERAALLLAVDVPALRRVINAQSRRGSGE